VTSESFYWLVSSNFESKGLSIANATIVYSIVDANINQVYDQIGLEVIDLQGN